jgi:bifunctional non-homologous end joining protein LigD
MLAMRWAEPFVDPSWAFELKWDGIRAILTFGDGRPLIRSRAGNDLSGRYPDLAAHAPQRPLVLDGEIVAFDESGRPSFEVLQQRMGLTGRADVAEAMRTTPVAFAAFDVLFDGAEVIDEPWELRRRRLELLALAPPYVVSHVVPGDPTGLWELVQERGIEGIVAKRLGSVYRPGERSPDWRKITRFRQVRAVVGGYLPGEGGRAGTFGSLLLGLHDAGGLRWIGSVGSGFSDAALAAIREALDAMTIGECPFVPDPELPRSAVWVEPHLVAVVQYKEFTGSGRLRGPSFKGFTDDDPTAITWQAEGPDGPG